MTLAPPQPVLQFDDGDSPTDVIDVLLLAPFVDGSQPWSSTRRLARVRDGASVLPVGVVPIREANQRHVSARLATGDGWTFRTVRWRDGSAYLTVVARDEELGTRLLDEVVEAAEAPPPPPDESVAVGFWFATGNGASRRERVIDVEPWADIRTNYSAGVAAAFDRVTAMTTDRLSGRLMLLHGPPGTGKTTLLRALAHAWRSWCQVDLVLDPERLFGDPGYLMTVALGFDDDHDPGRRWRLVLLEDSDELIRGGAKEATGQALARLLNITDGLVGQGLDLLVGITTNEPLARLHPAVTRAGRCLAEIEVGPLSAPEARRWLRDRGSSTRVSQEATLAELFALRGDVDVVEEHRPAVGGGIYL